MKTTLILLALFCASCSNITQSQQDDTPLQTINTTDLQHPACGFGW